MNEKYFQIPRCISQLVLALVLLIPLVVTAEDIQGAYKKLAVIIPTNARTAIAEIYEEESSNVTALSYYWRNRLSQGLTDERVVVIARHDLGVVMEDNELHGGKEDIANTGADVAITASYIIYPKQSLEGQDEIELIVRAISSSDGKLLGSVTIRDTLKGKWQNLASKVIYNIRKNNSKSLGNDSGKSGPKLMASLNRDPACYPSGGEAVISIEAERGVYLYILLLAEDQTATILHPNRIMPEKKMETTKLEFPPLPMRKSGSLSLQLYPLGQMDTKEEFKVIASRKPLDFSFLPIPENQLFSGAQGGDLKKMMSVLNKAKESSEIDLSYWVGPGCSEK